MTRQETLASITKSGLPLQGKLDALTVILVAFAALSLGAGVANAQSLSHGWSQATQHQASYDNTANSLAAVTALPLGAGAAMAKSEVTNAVEGAYFSGQHQAASNKNAIVPAGG